VGILKQKSFGLYWDIIGHEKPFIAIKLGYNGIQWGINIATYVWDTSWGHTGCIFWDISNQETCGLLPEISWLNITLPIQL
jgi:hypothetical protein